MAEISIPRLNVTSLKTHSPWPLVMGVKVEPTTPLVAELGRKHPEPTQPQERKSGTQLSFSQAR
jgi:hypothetical protein